MNLFRQWVKETSCQSSTPSLNDMQVEICHFDDQDAAQVILRVPLSEFAAPLKARPVAR